MSSTYASRFRILPIEVKPNEVVIATSEPLLTEWIGELAVGSGCWVIIRHLPSFDQRELATKPSGRCLDSLYLNFVD